MKSPFFLIYGIVVLTWIPADMASGSPILWTFTRVTRSYFGAAHRTFTFNPDTATPCGFASPRGGCGSVDIVMSTGSSRTATTYSFVRGQNVVDCTGVEADSPEVLFLAADAVNHRESPRSYSSLRNNRLATPGTNRHGWDYRYREQLRKRRDRSKGELP
jgi:hypothetical protein